MEARVPSLSGRAETMGDAIGTDGILRIGAQSDSPSPGCLAEGKGLGRLNTLFLTRRGIRYGVCVPEDQTPCAWGAFPPVSAGN